jgi:hypothetical protein
MTSNPGNPGLKVLCIDYFPAEEQGRDEILQDVPGSAGGLVIVAGVAVGDTFAQSAGTLRLEDNQDAFTVGGRAK